MAWKNFKKQLKKETKYQQYLILNVYLFCWILLPILYETPAVFTALLGSFDIDSGFWVVYQHAVQISRFHPILSFGLQKV